MSLCKRKECPKTRTKEKYCMSLHMWFVQCIDGTSNGGVGKRAAHYIVTNGRV